MAATEGPCGSRSRRPRALRRSLCLRHRCARAPTPHCAYLTSSWCVKEILGCPESSSCALQVADSDSRYLLQLGPSSECSAPCGGGTMQKPLACMDTVLGLPVEMTMCSLNRTMLGQLSEPCNTQQYASARRNSSP